MAGSWPFVGRTGELARADAILAAGAGVLLLGDAGIGKTALARRLAERAAGGGGAVIQVVGRAVSSGAPFEAFAGVLTGQRPADPAARGSGPGSAAEVTAAEVTAAEVTAAEVAARVTAAAPAPSCSWWSTMSICSITARRGTIRGRPGPSSGRR